MSQKDPETKLMSTLGAILNLFLVAIPMDIIRWLSLRRKCVKDQVIFITGAGSGLGQRMAEIFALELGAKLALCDIDEIKVNSVVAEIKSKGGIAEAWKCDVSDVDSMNVVAAQVRKCLGPVDIVVCNAGILYLAHTLQLKTEQLQRALNVNVMGTINTIRAFLGEMMERNSGQIVGISSITGYYGETYGMAYCPTKFAVRGIMECLQHELEDFGLNGIACTTLCPYFVRTPMILSLGMRPTSRLIPFMSIERCSRQIIDAILKEKVIAFVPSWITIMPMISVDLVIPLYAQVLGGFQWGRVKKLSAFQDQQGANPHFKKQWLSVNMRKTGRKYLNCCYEPIRNEKQEQNCYCNEKTMENEKEDEEMHNTSTDNQQMLHINKIGRENNKNNLNGNAIVGKESGEPKTNNCCHFSTINDESCSAATKIQNQLNTNDNDQTTMANFFKVPHFSWFLIIPPALSLTFLIWYAPELFNAPYLGTFGKLLHYLGTKHSTSILIINVVAWVIHFAEAEYVLLICNELDFTHTCALRWFAQTFLLGFPSLRLIRAYRAKKQQIKNS